LSFSISTSHASSNFELLHLDIWGPLFVSSIHGHRYFLTIVDDHSRFLWIILLKTKSKVSHHVKSFIKMVQTQFHVTPKCIRSDNGPEFLIPSFYESRGILHQKSCVETPQQNGRVERKHQHILNVGRALLYQSKLPASYWSYALLHAVFLINRIPTYFRVSLLIMSFIANYLILILSKFLVVFVMLLHFNLTEPNLNPELEKLSS